MRLVVAVCAPAMVTAPIAIKSPSCYRIMRPDGLRRRAAVAMGHDATGHLLSPHSIPRAQAINGRHRRFAPLTLPSVDPPAMVIVSAMRWMPRPNSCAFFAVRVRVLTPIQAISDDRRPYSIFGQRFITTLRPVASASGRLVVAHAELHPDHLRARRERQRLLDDRQGILRGAEDVDHVDRLGNVGELGVGLAAEQFLAGEARVDRDHAVAALEQIFEGEIARPAVIGRDPDHGDRLHRVEDAADCWRGTCVGWCGPRPSGRT